jgi:hypothetical protein
MSSKMCKNDGKVVRWTDNPDPLHHMEAQAGFRPVDAKRIRMTCPRCKRRLWSSVMSCHDGCCIIHTIPPHKVKAWWKKGNRKKGKKVSHKRR